VGSRSQAGETTVETHVDADDGFGRDKDLFASSG
jgi:hypothetical protein